MTLLPLQKEEADCRRQKKFVFGGAIDQVGEISRMKISSPTNFLRIKIK